MGRVRYALHPKSSPARHGTWTLVLLSTLISSVNDGMPQRDEWLVNMGMHVRHKYVNA